jgi:hypothetical protein
MTFEMLFKLQVLGELSKRNIKRDKEIYSMYLNVYKDIEHRISTFYIDLGLPAEDAAKTWWIANEYNRLNILKLQIEKQMLNMLEGVDSYTERITAIRFQESYLFNNFAVSKFYDALIDYPLLDKNLIKAAVNSDMGKIGDKTLMRSDRLAAIQDVKKVMTSSLSEGLSYSDAGKLLQKVFGVDPTKPGLVDTKGLTYKALRVARTEGHRVQEMANDLSWQASRDMGITKSRRYLSILDPRTREQSSEMDGQESDEEGRFRYPDGNYYFIGQTGHPEWDINDRCDALTNLPDEIPSEFRGSVLGKIENMNFDDYVEKYPLVEDLFTSGK